jgi:hypothetical protein
VAFLNQRRRILCGSAGDLVPEQITSLVEGQTELTIRFHESDTNAECSMSEAEEYTQNARICASCAETTKSESDRTIWLRMSEAWRDLATIAQQRACTIRQSEAAAAA